MEATKYRIDNGLIVSGSTDCPQCTGYIFDFSGHGAYEPNGKIGNLELTREQIDTHNKLLAQIEREAMIKTGRGILYLLKVSPTEYRISQFNGDNKLSITRFKTSRHNFAGKNGRRDVWFEMNRQDWHGVNIGDSQILRVKRIKG
jgi:hypothetical protein